jgi:hypothetical protein
MAVPSCIAEIGYIFLLLEAWRTLPIAMPVEAEPVPGGVWLFGVAASAKLTQSLV